MPSLCVQLSAQKSKWKKWLRSIRYVLQTSTEHLRQQNISLSSGRKEIELNYIFNSEDPNFKPLLEIHDIEVKGLEAKHTKCHPCKFGYRKKEDLYCSQCPRAMIWDASLQKCTSCPDNSFSYSPFGKCIPKTKCDPEYDFIEKYSECKNGLQTRSVKLKEDSFCALQGPSLPLDKTINCRKCPPGKQFLNNKCVSCPPGKVSQGKDATCELCPAGHFPQEEIILDQLDVSPGKTTYCIAPKNKELPNACKFNEGWIFYQNTLTVHPRITEGTTLVMKIEEKFLQSGIFSFDLKRSSNIEEFELIINGTKEFVLFKNNLLKFSKNMPQGLAKILFIYRKTSSQKIENPLKITDLHMEGVSSPGHQCSICPGNTYKEEGGQYCRPCPRGKYSSEDHTHCINCPENFMYNTLTRSCGAIPQFLKPTNDERVYDFYPSYKLNNSLILMNYLTNKENKFNLMGNQIGGLIGPIPTNKRDKKLFFSLNSVAKFGTSNFEYTLKQEGSQFGHFFLVSSDPNNNEKEVTNLGSKLSSIILSQAYYGKVILNYVDGDLCDAKVRHSTNVNLICNKDKIMEVSFDYSNKHPNVMTIKSKYVCPICKISEVTSKNGSCDGGTNPLIFKAIQYCDIPSLEAEHIDIYDLSSSKLSSSVPISELEAQNFVMSKTKNQSCSFLVLTSSRYNIFIAFVVVLAIVFVAVLIFLLIFVCKDSRAKNQDLASQEMQPIPISGEEDELELS